MPASGNMSINDDDDDITVGVKDEFFDDDITINDGDAVPSYVVGSVAKQYGTLHYDAPSIAAAEASDEAEEEKAQRFATLQRTASQYGDFRMGNDEPDSDEEDEDISLKPDEEQPVAAASAQRGVDTAGAKLFSNNAVYLEDEDDFHSNGYAAREALSTEFNQNPLMKLGLNAEANDAEFADNAIGSDQIFSVDTPTAGGKLPSPKAGENHSMEFRMVIDASELENREAPVPMHQPASSRVFSYDDEVSPRGNSSLQPGVSPSNQNRHFKLQLHSKNPSLADPAAVGIEIDRSPSPQFTPLHFNDVYATMDGDQVGALASASSSSPPAPRADSMLHPDSARNIRSYRSDSLVAQGGGLSVVNRSPSPQPSNSGRSSPAGFHRPSLSSLSPETIHNRRSIVANPNLPQPVRQTRRLSHLSQIDLTHIDPAHRKHIDELLTITEDRQAVAFPYRMDKPLEGRDSYEMVAQFPAIPESERVKSFREPPVGAVTCIKGEEVKPVMLSDAVFEPTNAPSRFTRPLRKREFHASQQIRGLSALVNEFKRVEKHDHIECVILFNEGSTPIKQDYADLLSQLPRLETLQLQEVKIKKWGRAIQLPNLLNLDARNCKIKSIEYVQQMVMGSPNLYSLTISDNPVCEKFVDPQTKKPILPPIDHSIWKQLLLRLPSLEYFNLLPIDNATRLRAYQYTKSKKLYPIVSSTLWHMALNSAPSIVALQQSGGWQPTAIVELSLCNQSLLGVNLSPLRHSIERLDLSSNCLSTLVGTGLHLCKNLRILNLGNNRFQETQTTLDEMHYFSHLPLLQSLYLCGSPGFLNYHGTVIYATRHLKGTNRCPGLQLLDGDAVTLDQRINAYEKYAMNGKAQSMKERWRLLCISYFGHQQLIEMPNVFSKLRINQNPELFIADVSAFSGLVQLDLNSNKLKSIEGLEKLTKLRFLDVRFNPELNLKILIAQIQHICENIEWISLSHSEEEMNDLTGLRLKFLLALLPSCPKLAILDHRLITIHEYVRVFTRSRNLEKDNPKRLDYLLNLGLMMNNTPFVGRFYDFDRCIPNIAGKSQVMFENVKSLTLSNLKLKDSFAIPNLPNLTLLNISHNKYTVLTPLGLHRFPELLFLDLRDNKLKLTPMEIAAATSGCTKLYGFALAGNPAYNPKFRAKLIACIPELGSLDCNLRIIDTQVSVDERVAAWGVASHLLSEGEGEAPWATPSKSDQTKEAGSANVSPNQQPRLSVYQAPLPDPSNKRLYEHTLKANKDNISIHELAKRTLRAEREARIGHVANSKKYGEEAKSPSSAGANPNAVEELTPSQANPELSSRLVAMHKQNAKVKMEDDISSQSKEANRIITQKEQEELEKNIFKFHLILQERCPLGVENKNVKELALESMALRWVDFRSFGSLNKLLISKNQLTTLSYSGIETCKNLTVFDAHHNKLTNLSEVIAICNELPNLEFISFFKNPFAYFDSSEAAPNEKAASPDADGKAVSLQVGFSSHHSAGHLYSAEKYRLTFIGHLQQLQTPARKLKYFDHAPISEDEIIHGLKELGHSSTEREMFRFNSIVFGKDGLNPSFQTLDLSNRKVQRADFSRFPYLTALNLHKNEFDDITLSESNITTLKSLTELNVSENHLKSMRMFADVINQIPSLKILKISSNPGYSRSDSEKARRHFLASFPNIHMSNFKLEFVNGMKISIEERLDAMHHARNHWQQLHGHHQAHPSRVSVDAAIASPDDDRKSPSPNPFSQNPLSPSGALSSPVSPMSSPVSPSAVSPMSQSRKLLSPSEILAQGGVELSLEEDIHVQMENARFILTVHEMHLAPNATEVNLRKRNLRTLGGLTLGLPSFENLQIVDLRENHLTDLKDSGIEFLKHLSTLDLRLNEFHSLDSLVGTLRGCNRLQSLYIQFSTKNHDETSVPANYTHEVFTDLRGLHSCDEMPNDRCVDKDPLAKSAQELLWKIAKIGPNNLRRVDLHNRRLPANLFYQILSPLYYLDIQELMAGGNNEFTTHPNYSDVIILLLGPKFKWLDGVEINDHRRMLAFRADKQGKESGKITGNLVVWEDNYKEIHEAIDEWLEAEKLRNPEHDEDGNKVKREQDVDYRIDLPNMQGIQVASQSAASNSSMISAMISKVEIVIHYLQVYGMVLVMDIHIPYPQVFTDWSKWVQVSTLNLSDIFNLDADWKLDVLFALIMLVPAMFIGLYFYFDRMRGQEKDWEYSYVTRWNMVKWRTFCLWLLLIIISTAGCFIFIDGFQTLNELKASRQPTPASLTWAIILFVFFTFWYFVWFRIVRLFQKHWKLDDTEFKLEFKQKWLNLIHWIQIILLFLIVALYLPIARVILMQFACDKTNPDVYQSLVYSDRACFPSSISGVEIAALVFAPLYIICLPIFLARLISEGIGIVMELNTVHENLGKEIVILEREIVVLNKTRSDMRQAPGEREDEFQRKIITMNDTILNHKKLIHRKTMQQEAEYYARINDPVRKLASTSLYAAYEYRWRFWKILQLFQNLALVCISLFVPTNIGGVSQGRLLIGTFAIAACFFTSCYARPYFQSSEDAMEIFAGFANTVTVLVALGLQYNAQAVANNTDPPVAWLTDPRANAILLAANIAAVAAFIVAIVLVPCKIWSQKRRVKQQNKEAEKRLNALNEDTKRRAAERKTKENKQHIELAVRH